MDDKKMYEIAYFLSSSIAEDNVPEHVQKVRDLLSKYDCEITKEELPKIRPLAYPIKREKTGYFGYLQFKAGPDKIKEINSALALTDFLLRHLVTAISEKQTKLAEKEFIVGRQKPPFASQKQESIFKKENTASQIDQNKVALAELDQKLDEILKK